MSAFMNSLKYFIFFILIFLMLIPFFQGVSGFIKQTPLTGVPDTLSLPQIEWNGWLTQTYQKRVQSYAEEKWGFHPLFVRLKNQIDYSLFNYTRSGGVVIGREGTLFLQSYINNYCGFEFLGTRRIDIEAKRLAMVQRKLSESNTGFLLVLAPGKASFESSMIPDRFRKRNINNYDYFRLKLAAEGLNVLDLNAWFMAMKGKERYPVFPKNGVHWSSWAVALAADTLIKRLEDLRKVDLPEIDYQTVILSDTMRNSDRDAGDLMNLLRGPDDVNMPYPEITFDTNGKKQLSVISIADSYWWAFITSGITGAIFKDHEYWFYFREIYDIETKVGDVSEVDILKELSTREMVIVLLTEATWMLFPFGLTDAFLKDLVPENDSDKALQIELIMERIRRDAGWYQAIVQKAGKAGIPVEEQMRRDAIYLIGNKD